MARTTLNRRLDLRVSEDEKSEIDQAAALSGSTTSAFIRHALLTAARTTIQSHKLIRLTQEGDRTFVAAIKDPLPPNDNLRSLVREFGAHVDE